MIEYFRKAGKDLKGIKEYKFWQDGNHPEDITSNKFFDEKLEYIHENPVKELIVERPEDYFFSSARNYAGLNNYLEIVLESVKQNSYKKLNVLWHGLQIRASRDKDRPCWRQFVIGAKVVSRIANPRQRRDKPADYWFERLFDEAALFLS